MSPYRRLDPRLWHDDAFPRYSDDTKLLAFHLLTSPRGNMLGCFVQGRPDMAEYLGWPVERLAEPFAELVRTGFVRYDPVTRLVLLPNFLRYNPLDNENQAKAAAKVVKEIPYNGEFFQHLKLFLELSGKQFVKPLLSALENGLPKSSLSGAVTGAVTGTGTGAVTGTGTGAVTGTGKELPSPAARKTPRAASPPDTGPLWGAYRSAYVERYHADPVRNAKVNGILAQLLRRLPQAEAPEVAAFYLRHNGALYVRAGHPVELLLRDAEKLRTEWATGRMLTDTEAREADRRQGMGDRYRGLIAEAEREERGGT